MRREPPLYVLWWGMVQRCHNPRHTNYPGWGGRGIVVCGAWRESFHQFVADLSPRPSPQHSLDRIDNDGPYAPGNVRWATQAEQNRNMRTNRWLRVGDRVLVMQDWSAITGVPTSTMCNRVRRGWSDEDVVTKPVQPKAADNTLFPPGGRERCVELGLNVHTVASRLRRGWSFEDATTAPVDSKHASKVTR